MSNRVLTLIFALGRLGLACRYFLTPSPFVWMFAASECAACVVTLVNLRMAQADQSRIGRLVPVCYFAPLLFITGGGITYTWIALVWCCVASLILATRVFMGLSLTVGTPTYLKTITRGPYSLIRHPLAALEMTSVALLVVCYPRPWNIAALPLVLAAIRATAMIEEQYLVSFAEYRAYCKAVPRRFIPFLVLLLAGASTAGAVDAKRHNKDGCYQCNESHAHVVGAITWSAVTPGITVHIYNAASVELCSFSSGTGSGSGTCAPITGDYFAEVAGHVYGTVYTLQDFAASASVSAINVTGGRQITGLPIDDNALPGCSCPYSDAANEVDITYVVNGGPTPTPTATPDISCSWSLQVHIKPQCPSGSVGDTNGSLSITRPGEAPDVRNFTVPSGAQIGDIFYDGNDPSGTIIAFTLGSASLSHTVICHGDPHPPNNWAADATVGLDCHSSPTPTPTHPPGATPTPNGTPPTPPTPPPNGTPPPHSTPPSGSSSGVNVTNSNDFYAPVRQAIEDAGSQYTVPRFPDDRPDQPDFSDNGDLDGLISASDKLGDDVQAGQDTASHAFDGIKNAWAELPTSFGTKSELTVNLPGGYPATISLSSWSTVISMLRATLKFFLTISFAIATVRAFSFQH